MTTRDVFRGEGARVEEDFWPDEDVDEEPSDPQEQEAVETLQVFFEEHREQVFFSRQLEVRHEGQWFHWVTNRALRELVSRGVISREERRLARYGRIILMWHRSYRYYRRAAARLLGIVEEYADPNIGAALGLQGEAMVLEGFARNQFVMHGRNTRTFGSRTWDRTDHDLDFVFERDDIAYGVEVKNTLGYMDHDEVTTKIEMCEYLGIRPVFTVRMLPKTWIYEIVGRGGFALILKYQLYPWAHRQLARRVNAELGLPVDAPRALLEGTMMRFLRWHEQQV